MDRRVAGHRAVRGDSGADVNGLLGEVVKHTARSMMLAAVVFESWWQDVRLAVRSLLRAKEISVTAVVTLAVGIAGTTVMFALVDGVLLRPLPVRDQHRLVVAWAELPSSGATHWPLLLRDVETIRESSRLLERVAAVGYNGALPLVVIERDAASYVRAAAVGGDFFGVLGVDAILGRALSRADDVDGAENVLVISHALW